MLRKKIGLCFILITCSICGMFYNWIPSYIPSIALGVLTFIALSLYT